MYTKRKRKVKEEKKNNSKLILGCIHSFRCILCIMYLYLYIDTLIYIDSEYGALILQVLQQAGRQAGSRKRDSEERLRRKYQEFLCCLLKTFLKQLKTFSYQDRKLH